MGLILSIPSYANFNTSTYYDDVISKKYIEYNKSYDDIVGVETNEIFVDICDFERVYKCPYCAANIDVFEISSHATDHYNNK